MKISKLVLLGILSIFLTLNSTMGLLAQGIDSVSVERLKSFVNTLASDEYEGRLVGTKGNDLASEFIINQLKRINVKPINNSYTQNFEFTTGIQYGKGCNVTFTKLVEREGLPVDMWRKSDKKWTLGTEWLPMSFSDNATVSGELAFVGYGITATDNSYDDYAGLDVKGRVVIVLTDSAIESPRDKFFGQYADLKYKAENAKKHGAVGVIFIKALSDSANTFYPQNPEEMINKPGIVVIQATRTDIAQFFARNQMLYPSELEINAKKKPKSFLIPYSSVSISVDISPEVKTIHNIVGVIEGTEKKDNYILVSSNFDYLGRELKIPKYRKLPAQLLKGADDNASGVAVAMELACRLSANPLPYSVIFVFFNAKEKNNFGSDFFINHPVIPFNQIQLCLNLNMLGRLRTNKISIYGTNKLPEIKEIFSKFSIPEGLNPQFFDEFGISGDDKVLSRSIPVVTLSTGTTEDHRKYTDLPDKINYEGMYKITNFIISFLKGK